MVPTFLQKRSGSGHSLRVPLVLFSLLILTIIYTAAISFVIADRAFSRSGKLAIIAFLLVTALMSLGVLERLRR